MKKCRRKSFEFRESSEFRVQSSEFALIERLANLTKLSLSLVNTANLTISANSELETLNSELFLNPANLEPVDCPLPDQELIPLDHVPRKLLGFFRTSLNSKLFRLHFFIHYSSTFILLSGNHSYVEETFKSQSGPGNSHG